MSPALRIGYVDSGSAPQQASAVALARRFWLQGETLCSGAAEADTLGHGSAVLDAMREYAPNATYYSAQVFAGQWQTSPLQIAAALYWLLEQKVSLINLSVGLRTDRPVLREACAELQAAGVLLCASSPAQGEPVYPARYPGVIRMTGDARCTAGQWSWLNSQQADFGAQVRGQSGLAGASLACAVLTGHIGGYLSQQAGADREAVVQWLSQHATYVGPERRR